MKVLYHANCNDGSAAALAIWFQKGDSGVDYIPVQYGQDPPEGLEGEFVAIVDFSYKRNILLEIASKASWVLVLDHHKSAEKELEGLHGGNLEIHFNMEKSGAVMAWEYFHPGRSAPSLFDFIEDRDLWIFKYGNTSKYIHKALQVYDDWRTWEKFCYSTEKLREKGKFLSLFLDQKTIQIIKTPPCIWEVTGDTVPVYNLPGFMISDTLHAALEKYPESPYAVAYFDLHNDGKRVYSLRSGKGGTDVSEIARAHGGGGHENAAGFSVLNDQSSK